MFVVQIYTGYGKSKLGGYKGFSLIYSSPHPFVWWLLKLHTDSSCPSAAWSRSPCAPGRAGCVVRGGAGAWLGLTGTAANVCCPAHGAIAWPPSLRSRPLLGRCCVQTCGPVFKGASSCWKLLVQNHRSPCVVGSCIPDLPIECKEAQS